MLSDRFFYVNILDYTNNVSLSSYTLPATPLKFIPNIDNSVSNRRIIWKFGDGTTSTELTPSKYYNFPGTYQVEAYVFDTNNNSILNSYVQKVNIVDYLTDNLVIKQSLSTIEAGVVQHPFNVIRFNSVRSYSELSSIGYTITLYASGSNGNNLDVEVFNKNKYAHLYPYNAFYIEETNIFGNVELVPVNKVVTSNTELYCKIANNQIVRCERDETGSFLVGTSGSKTVYFVSDIPTTSAVNIFANFDTTYFNDYQSIGKNYNIIVNKEHPILQYITAKNKFEVVPHTTNNKLVFSANGVQTFSIDKNKFTNTEIPFVINITDQNNYPAKYFYTLSFILSTQPLSTCRCQIIAFDENNNQLPCYIKDLTPVNEKGGYFKGSATFLNTANNVYLSAATIVNNSIITGTSNTFNVYDKEGKYHIGKVGENVDMTSIIKSYRTQEVLFESPQLFDNFIGTIVGNLSSDPNTLGKKIYEKVSNFVNNNIDIDTCNVQSLASIYQMLGDDITKFDRFNFTYPAELSRLVDLFSIKQSVLWGTHDKFAENFDKKSFINNRKYGLNIGDKLDFLTTTLSAGSASSPIVVYEKFSEKYKLVNTNLLKSTFVPINSSNNTYPLSSYNKFWGWGLVLPDDYAQVDIPKYYDFYKYVLDYSGTQLEGTINWSDLITTLSITESGVDDWSSIQENILSHQLYKGLNLVSNSVSGNFVDIILPPSPVLILPTQPILEEYYQASWSGDASLVTWSGTAIYDTINGGYNFLGTTKTELPSDDFVIIGQQFKTNGVSTKLTGLILSIGDIINGENLNVCVELRAQASSPVYYTYNNTIYNSTNWPGEVIAVIYNGTAPNISNINWALTGMNTPTLTPHTKYWITLRVSNAGSIEWKYADGSIMIDQEYLANNEWHNNEQNNILYYDAPFMMKVYLNE